MSVKAILFGSIGTIVETSEFQRQAFNAAFAEAGLDWNWDQDEYRQLLAKSGGRQRVADYAAKRGDTVDAVKIHARKTQIFDQAILDQGLAARAGVSDVIAFAKENGIKLGFVTSTTQANIDAIFQALGDTLVESDFEFIGDASLVANSKPDPAIYKLALRNLALTAEDCIAIEDTATSMEAAQPPKFAALHSQGLTLAKTISAKPTVSWKPYPWINSKVSKFRALRSSHTQRTVQPDCFPVQVVTFDDKPCKGRILCRCAQSFGECHISGQTIGNLRPQSFQHRRHENTGRDRHGANT